MSLSNRRRFLTLGGAFCALSACGFTPAYGPSSTGRALRGRVGFEAPSSREGYLLVEALRRGLGEPRETEFTLKTTVNVSQRSVGITRDQEITRYHLLGEANYSLIDSKTGSIVASGQVNQFTAYSATGSTVDAISAPADAQERLMQILSDQIISELLVKADLTAEA